MLPDDKFCPRCAAPLEPKIVVDKRRPVCPNCGRIIYYNPKIAATTVVEKDGKVLMVRRAAEPGLGLWSLPGGYVDREEMVERAAEREVQEETGLHVQVSDLVGVYSDPGDPVVIITYDSRIVGGELGPGAEVSEASFFPLDQLPPLAFPRDTQILEAWRSLRNGRE